MSKKKIILTGAPCTGKTSLINELLANGYNCTEEFSRKIIKKEMSKKSNALPWKDLLSFSQKLVKYREKTFLENKNNELCFFDRSIIDIIAYLKIENIDIPRNILEMTNKYRYYKTVFFAPVWKEIFKKDKERKENLKQAIIIEKYLLGEYKKANYKIVFLPKISIKERINFIFENI